MKFEIRNVVLCVVSVRFTSGSGSGILRVMSNEDNSPVFAISCVVRRGQPSVRKSDAARSR
jgi:hypothetical protein